VTPYTLMELANHDHPLLRRMQFEAPGTFHHSLMTASLSEAAAEAIQADALLTRVGCLYHDIGKMKRPLFFIENQAYFGADNPHDKLTPRLSKLVITAHPKDSLEMARNHHIPDAVQRFMTEHHGTMMAAYFYNKACQEEGAENVNKSQFRYPGPKPQSKETAIVMLADACESAVRALKNPTVAQIEERIDKIIWQRIDDGQFDQCPLTFRDISVVKETFVRVLRGIQHNRIEYQQNIMRDLGRKIQAVKADASKPDPSKIDELLKDIQKPVSGNE
jgi:cyclic-di-AMP phosphodiesterase PgpH